AYCPHISWVISCASGRQRVDAAAVDGDNKSVLRDSLAVIPMFLDAPSGAWRLPMSAAATDRNLLFGILALQMDFISRDALSAAMGAWVVDKAKSLGQVLRAQGQLTAERLQLLEALVGEHLRAHSGDAQQSLAALSSASSVQQDLQQL